MIGITTHACPRCGQSTSGSYSEGGCRWAMCDDCMNAERRHRSHVDVTLAEDLMLSREEIDALLLEEVPPAEQDAEDELPERWDDQS